MMVFGSADDSVLRKIEARLDAIYRLIELQTRPQIEAAVRKLGTTKERRKAWILADGQRKTEDIARLSGNALRTIQMFVQETDRAGLMDASRRGYPRRRFDVIPSDWDGEINEVDKALEPPPSS